MNKKTTIQEEKGYGRILKYAGLFGGVHGMTLAVSVLRFKLAAKLLGPAGCGMVSIFTSTLNLFGNCTNLGISFSAVRNVSQAYESGDRGALDESLRVIRTWSLLTALLGTLLCLLCAPLLSSFTFNGNLRFTWHYLCLAPVVGFTAFAGGELAILKATRRLKRVALCSLLTVAASLLLSVPLYFLWGFTGIVPALFLTSAASALLVALFSFRQHPYRVALCDRRVMQSGMGMVRLGISFIIAGVVTSGVEVAVRTWVLGSEWGAVGLYNCASTLLSTLAGLLFASVDSDYFPRLSAVNGDALRCRQMANRQIEASLLFAAPLLTTALLLMPLLLPLLSSGEFFAAVPMVQLALPGLLFKAVAMPVAYLALARGDSLTFLLQETLSGVALFALAWWGYRTWGLLGAGLAYSAAGLFDVLSLALIARLRYRFGLGWRAVGCLLGQLALMMGALVALTFPDAPAPVRWASLGCLLLSWAMSIYILQRNSDLLPALIGKLKKKFGLKK